MNALPKEIVNIIVNMVPLETVKKIVLLNKNYKHVLDAAVLNHVFNYHENMKKTWVRNLKTDTKAVTTGDFPNLQHLICVNILCRNLPVKKLTLHNIFVGDLTEYFPNLETLKLIGCHFVDNIFPDSLKTLIIKDSRCTNLFIPDSVDLKVTLEYEVKPIIGGKILNSCKFFLVSAICDYHLI